MGEQPDRPCAVCEQFVSRDADWLTVHGNVYHYHCFTCHKCKQKLTLHTLNKTETDQTKPVCTKCKASKPVRTPGRVACSALQSVRMHDEDSQERTNQGATAQCVHCGKSVPKTEVQLSRSGNEYCSACYGCVNCGVPIEDNRCCFELLEQVGTLKHGS